MRYRAARVAMFQAQCRNRGAVLAVGHGGCSLGNVLQAGRAGVRRDGLLRQRHEDDGAGGELSPEDAGEKHVAITDCGRLTDTSGVILMRYSFTLGGCWLETYEKQYFEGFARV